MDSNLNSIRANGLRVLVQGLGPVGTVNFLRQFEGGSGNYTDEREALLDGIAIDDIAARIRVRKDVAG